MASLEAISDTKARINLKPNCALGHNFKMWYKKIKCTTRKYQQYIKIKHLVVQIFILPIGYGVKT
jgi:hypothetical protein